MNSANATLETIRLHTQQLLASIGVSRIVVVDDQYDELEVERLLGLASTLEPDQLFTLPHLTDIDFRADPEVWTDLVRGRWDTLDAAARRTVLARTRAYERTDQPTAPPTELDTMQEQLDTQAAQSLGDILNDLEDCSWVALSLSQWRTQADALLTDDRAASTILLFDKDFSKEEAGTENAGIDLVRHVQETNIGYCGLMTHTVRVGDEYDAWRALTADYGLDPDKFIVIAKERLTGESQDYYEFLRMLRFVALTGHYARVKSAAWTVFERALDEARAAMERLSVLDFDRIVFASSRREGVWEPDTLLRVFALLMRREARTRLHQAEDVASSVAAARGISVIPEELAAALGEEDASDEALRIQRFESYECAEELNSFHVPIEVGDIFEKLATGRRYILLAQPCDLMVRPRGMRGYEDDRHGRTASLVEIRIPGGDEETKDSWEELPFYNDATGRSAFVDLARVHQVLLAVLDLCVLRPDGVATVDVDAPCPDLLIEPWKARYPRLQKFFRTALGRHAQMEGRPDCRQFKSLAFPTLSATVPVRVTAGQRTVSYDLKRVMRLRQPRAGALLTALTQYQARAAFEHPLDHRLPVLPEASDDQEPKTSAD